MVEKKENLCSRFDSSSIKHTTILFTTLAMERSPLDQVSHFQRYVDFILID